MYDSKMGRTMLTISSHFNSLTKSERKVATYVDEHPHEVIHASVTELAEKADVGETTVLRLCRKLKFGGFQEFKLSLAQDLAKYGAEGEADKELTEKSGAGVISSIVEAQKHALDQTRVLASLKDLNEAADKIIGADRIMLLGVGTSGYAAAYAARIFARSGLRAYSSSDSHFQTIDAALSGSNDVVIGLSVSGSTIDTVDNLRLARQAGGYAIAVTSAARSPLTKQADMILLTASREDPLQGSSLEAAMSQLAVMEILLAIVNSKRADDANTFRKMIAQALASKLY